MNISPPPKLKKSNIIIVNKKGAINAPLFYSESFSFSLPKSINVGAATHKEE